MSTRTYVSLGSSSDSSVSWLNVASRARQRATRPHILDFNERPDSNVCPTRQWYMSLSTTKFRSLQYRKCREDLKHEFIVAELDDDIFCRFDRRLTSDRRGEVALGKEVEAEDSVQIFSRHDSVFEEVQATELKVTVNFPHKEDLIVILAVCYGIHVDEEAKQYSLFRFNCYFFSWSILLATARCSVSWSAIIRDSRSWDNLVESTLKQLGNPQVQSRSKMFSEVRQDTGIRCSIEELPFFVGGPYLVETLRAALIRARTEMGQVIDSQILQSAIGNDIRALLHKYLDQPALDAAKKHAYHAARDAALEAVVETMWQTMFLDPNAGSEWEAKSRATEQRIREAADVAADVDIGTAYAGQAWENAWDNSWGRTDANSIISTRAKAAWRDAWTKACVANEAYHRNLSNTVVAYVEDHLPDSTPDILDVEKPHPLKLRPQKMTNASFQEYILKRIHNLEGISHRMVDEAKIIEGLCRVWKNSMALTKQDWK